MKEQVVTPRAGRSAAASKGRQGEIVQRPAKRDRGGSNSRSKATGARKILAYLPLATKIALAVILGTLLFAGYRAAASASFFQARTVDVTGTSRVSVEDIRTIVRRHLSQTNVWRADLDAISRDLRNVPGVRTAVVSRVLPDGLRVRVTERTPAAIVRTHAGKLIWVDDEAVTLGAASPSDKIFMRGWDEEETDASRAQNRERVQKFLEMNRDWDALGLSRRISEVNLYDLSDVRAQLTGADSQIEVQLGGEDFGNRLKVALEELDKQRNTPVGPFIVHVNVSRGVERGNHVAFGVSPDAPTFSNSGTDAGAPEIERTKAGEREVVKPRAESRKEKEKVARKDEARARDKNQARSEKDKKEKNDKKEQASRDARTEGRPRRVGR